MSQDRAPQPDDERDQHLTRRQLARVSKREAIKIRRKVTVSQIVMVAQMSNQSFEDVVEQAMRALMQRIREHRSQTDD